MEASARRDVAAAAEAAAAAERQTSHRLRVEVETLNKALASERASAEALRRALAERTAEREATVADLTARLASLTKQVEASNAPALEGRLAALVATLAARQANLEQASAEVVATRRKLDAQMAAAARLQGELDAAQAREARLLAGGAGTPSARGGSGAAAGGGFIGGGDFDDDFSGTGGGELADVGSGSGDRIGGYGGATAVHRGGDSLLYRGSGGRAGDASITPLKRVSSRIARNKRAEEFADLLDQWSVTSFRFLLRNPLARLLFLLYFALLQSWALFVLVFHTHALPHDAHSHGAMPLAPKLKP